MLFSDSQLTFAKELTDIAYTNPFEQETVQQLEEIAGKADIALTVDGEAVKRHRVPDRPRMPLLLEKAKVLIEHFQPQVGKNLSQEELRLYEDLCLLVLYFRFRERFQQTFRESTQASAGSPVKVDYFGDYRDEFRRLLSPAGSHLKAAHLFACHFQIRQAYDLIYSNVFGRSPVMQKLRANIWYSVFTHDMRRYRTSLFEHMHEISTLITGESGTGKELVARAVGLSRYVKFNPDNRQFTESVSGAFHPINMAALSPQLIESELFGHVEGAFSGAIKDREGWFEICRPNHSVFLDEIGELDPTLQVKLLRVLQTREFNRVGESDPPKDFPGKIIAATHRNLAEEIQAGRFRADVYYRLCADQIHTPSLKEQLQDQPEELENIVQHLAQGICEYDHENVTQDVLKWITQHLPADYAWPGNFRELEQCVRNVLVRQEYCPLPTPNQRKDNAFLTMLGSCRLSVADLTRVYATLIYRQMGSYVASGRILGVDRRTVPGWLLTDEELESLCD